MQLPSRFLGQRGIFLCDYKHQHFQFSPDGKHIHPEKVLKQFSGLLISDAHRAYESASLRDDIQWQVCWAHARRKFVEAQSGSPEVKDEIIELFKQIFLKERAAWEMTPDRRLCFREEQIKPYVDRVFEIVKHQREQVLLPKNKFSEAVNYMYSRETYFRTFLENSQATIDNNLSERTIKPLVIGRKNWMFLGSKDSGKSTAAILTLVQTCRHLKIDPYKYLVDVIEKIMGYNSQKIYELLPDQWLKKQDT